MIKELLKYLKKYIFCCGGEIKNNSFEVKKNNNFTYSKKRIEK